jgi:hypothetical protein
VSLTINLEIAPSVAGSILTRRYAGQAAVVLDKLLEFIGVEALVADENHGYGQKRRKLFGCGCLSALTGGKQASHDVSAFINGRSEL